MTDWTSSIISYGESRNWARLPQRRALRQFAEATGTERRSGFGADLAFRCGYNALAAATPERRARVTTWEDVKALQREQEAEREARIEAARTRFAAEMDALADVPGWTLLAGERTDVVATGTRSQVESELPRVTTLPRDRSSGCGCWSIVAPDGREWAAGEFDGSGYW